MKVINSLLLGLFALSACTGSSSRNSTGAKVLYLTFGDDVRTADPAAASDMESAELLGHIFEGLVRFSYLGPAGGVEPSLATVLPKITDKSKVLKFTLKSGVRFADDPAFKDGKGREIVAGDFIYSFKRVCDASIGEANFWMFDGMVEGLNEWHDRLTKSTGDERKKIFEEAIPGLKAPDARTLEIRFKRPYPQILYVLSMPATAVVAREVVEKYGAEIGNHPVGTGPYMLNDWVHGSKIVAKRNANFREEHYPSAGNDDDRQSGRLQAAGSKLPYVDEIQWDIIKEEQPRWLKFLKGQLDETTIPKDSFNDAIGADGELRPDLSTKSIVLRKELSLTTWWIEYNMRDPLLGANLKLRQALAMAFDRKRALELLYNNRGMLASGPIPPTYEGGQGPEKYPYDLNLEKAKKLLADAGYPGGKGLPDLVFDLRGPGTTQRQLGELLADNYSKIGVHLKIMGNSFTEALDKAKNAKFQIMLGGWHADYPDPENYLQLFISGNKAPGSNSSNFSDAEYDKLYEAIRVSPPSSKRAANIARMVQILNDKAPVAFFFHAVDYRVAQAWLKNYKPHQLLYGTGRYLDIDMALREKLFKEKF